VRDDLPAAGAEPAGPEPTRTSSADHPVLAHRSVRRARRRDHRRRARGRVDLDVVGSDGVEADAEAVCGIIERTPPYTEDASVEELRRWGVTEVGPSLAAQDAKYKPLADALTEALEAIQQFDREGMDRSVDRVKELCEDL
jgi:hypothetical protein